MNDNHLFLIGQILGAKAEHRVSVRRRCGVSRGGEWTWGWGYS